jgi:hypothetical protein
LAQGTGSFGRVTEDDVKLAAGIAPPAPAPAAAAASGGAPWPTGMTPMTSMQKAIAKNMEATLAVPVFRVTKQIVTDDFDLLYAKLRPEGVTVSALLAKARRSSIRCVTVSRFRSGRVRSVSRFATSRDGHRLRRGLSPQSDGDAHRESLRGSHPPLFLSRCRGAHTERRPSNET